MSLRSSRTLQALLRLALAASLGLASSAAAETKVIRDDQGRVVLEIRDDGTRIVHRYGPDGREVESPPPPPPAPTTQTPDAKH